MSTPFSVSKHNEADGVVVLTVAGDIDESTDDALLCMIENSVHATPMTELVVDLAHVTFLGSCGIRALLVGRDTVIAQGATFRVSNPHGVVREVLQLTQLTQLLNVTPATASSSPPHVCVGFRGEPDRSTSERTIHGNHTD